MIHTSNPSAVRKLAMGIFLLLGSSSQAASVSELEKSLTPGTATGSEANPSLPSPSNDSLIKALEDAGWNASRTATGDILLRPHSVSGNDVSPLPFQDNRWRQLRQQLEKTGWSTSEDADGSLVLRPPRHQPIPEEPEQPKGTGPLAGMRDQLEAAGWRIEETADNSILLYPPGKHEVRTVPHCAGVLTRYQPILPVDSWKKAHDVAQSWLEEQSGMEASVGRIRRILGVHIISIVSSRRPYHLLHQLAIRNSDGAVIVLD